MALVGGPWLLDGATATPTGAAASEAVATIAPSFSVDRLGARTAATLTFSDVGGPNGVPGPLAKALLRLPAGLAGSRLQWPTTAGCSAVHLRRDGARGCPARSQVGAGSALLKWPEGGTAVGTEQARVWVFVAPTDGEYALEILGEGTKPVRRRVVIRVPLAVETGAYSADLELLVPPIPAFPGEQDASIVRMALTLGNARPPGHGKGLGIFVPKSCPQGGFPWEVQLTYTDGSTGSAAATIPCP